MKLATRTKQPREVKDYDVDFAPWLTPMNDTLDTVTATVECVTDPADTSLLIDSTTYTATRLKLWISGGTSGQRYKITVQAVTVGGRTDESEIIFRVKEI